MIDLCRKFDFLAQDRLLHICIHTLGTEDCAYKTRLPVRKYNFDPNTFKPSHESNSCYITDIDYQTFEKYNFRKKFFYEQNGRYWLHEGVIDLSKCFSNMPVFMSMPHFLNAHESYFMVKGLQPNQTLHEPEFYVNQRIGVFISFYARIQFNLLLKNMPNIAKYRLIPSIIFPVFWCEVGMQLPIEFLRKMEGSLFLFSFITATITTLLIIIGLGYSAMAFSAFFNVKFVPKGKF